VNVIRFNFSHASYSDAEKSVKMIEGLNKTGKTNLSILLDTK
jgi:pyruvate kinase